MSAPYDQISITRAPVFSGVTVDNLALIYVKSQRHRLGTAATIEISITRAWQAISSIWRPIGQVNYLTEYFIMAL